MALALGALAGLCVVLAINYALPIIWKERAIARLRERCRETRTLVLTYDDGPSALTPKVLEVLAEHGARATFFVPSNRLEGQVQTLEQVRERGHEIGAHSKEHLHAWRTWPWASHRDAVSGWRALERSGVAPTLYRPAYGKVTASLWRALVGTGASFAWWTIDSGDSFRSFEQEKGRAEQKLLDQGGGVVLLHDSMRRDGHAAFVLETTRSLLALAEREGFRVLPMGEFLSE